MVSIKPGTEQPLFLDLYCRTAQLQPALLTHTAPSLTGVLSEYLAAMDKPVRELLDADPRDIIVMKACLALAETMQQKHRPWLSRDEAKQVTEVPPTFRTADPA
jgi:hypothetical protein